MPKLFRTVNLRQKFDQRTTGDEQVSFKKLAMSQGRFSRLCPSSNSSWGLGSRRRVRVAYFSGSDAFPVSRRRPRGRTCQRHVQLPTERCGHSKSRKLPSLLRHREFHRQVFQVPEAEVRRRRFDGSGKRRSKQFSWNTLGACRVPRADSLSYHLLTMNNFVRCWAAVQTFLLLSVCLSLSLSLSLLARETNSLF